jgi:hypothetical protein
MKVGPVLELEDAKDSTTPHPSYDQLSWLAICAAYLNEKPGASGRAGGNPGQSQHLHLGGLTRSSLHSVSNALPNLWIRHALFGALTDLQAK